MQQEVDSMKGLILAMLALAVLVAACAAHVENAPTTTQPVKTDDVVQAQQDLGQVDNLTSDLNFSDLDGLDQSLDFG